MVRVEDSKICPVYTADVASDDKSSKQESKSYMLTDASLVPEFIFDLWE